MSWSWLFRRKPKGRNLSTGEDRELARARELRLQAEQKLNEARRAARELSKVVVESRLIRNENRFSERLNEAFGSRHHNNG